MGLRHRIARVVRNPAFGVVVLTPVVLAGAVAASPGRSGVPVSGIDVAPRVAVESSQPESQGLTVVAMAKPPADFRVAATAGFSPPPPAAVVNAAGGMRIPGMALSAYRKAEQTMATAVPGCGVSWNLLAGIGRIESSHANGGATDARGTAVRPIYGPVLDGTLPGNEIIVQSNVGGRATYARAMGPMQFLPGTWSRYASDGDGDGRADPQNLFDASLSAARYLCSGGLNLRNQAQVFTAILRYNNSMPYAQNVLGWAAAYATGVAPTDLPAINGPVPALGALHLENPEGLGPGMLAGDPLAELPLFNLGNTELAGQLTMPGPTPEAANSVLPEHGCQVICMASQLPPATPTPNLPPWMLPPTPAPWLAPPPLGVNPPGAPPIGPALPGPAPVPAPAGSAPLGPTPLGPTPLGPTPLGPTPLGPTPLPGLPAPPGVPAPLPGLPPAPVAPWLPPAPLGAPTPPEGEPAPVGVVLPGSA